MTGILIGTGVLAAVALVFSLLLTLANKVFEVPSDPKRDQIREALPGANCGACGYPGCDGLADAIAAGKAPANTCPVGGSRVGNLIASIIGGETSADQVRLVATVVCQGTVDRCKSKFEYHGIQDCVAATLINDGNRSCQYACLGLGTCVRACKFDAIHIDEHDQIAVVDADKCTSCGACVKACPKKVLDLQPVTLPVRLLCRAAEEGHLVSDNCKVGCIGCELCMKACKFDAITMVNHLPQIDRDKCTGCMMCAEVCPTVAMWGDFDHRHIALIDRDLCIGCGICKKTCKFEAISGERKNVHEINEACTGCGECVPKCPKKAITLPIREHVRDANAKAGTQEGVIAIPKNDESKEA
ncbi:MAG TPA: RnfABCDGE type electron transport complex subunit B [Candidatus Limiplasma sp.]|nr:RnfABCDGE type electron transport complex subunit B [Candidatus Limiplasma sp.]HPS81135.1 RnfABCDGE type electron transport complex subunit B [Candidatus Limiplasma sp.]